MMSPNEMPQVRLELSNLIQGILIPWKLSSIEDYLPLLNNSWINHEKRQCLINIKMEMIIPWLRLLWPTGENISGHVVLVFFNIPLKTKLFYKLNGSMVKPALKKMGTRCSKKLMVAVWYWSHHHLTTSWYQIWVYHISYAAYMTYGKEAQSSTPFNIRNIKTVLSLSPSLYITHARAHTQWECVCV